MNIVDAMIANRVTDLLKELEALTLEVITEGQRKANSTAMADLMTQKELSPEMGKKMGMIHLQLSLLSNMASNVANE